VVFSAAVRGSGERPPGADVPVLLMERMLRLPWESG
jgi:hypothetical protein